MRFLTIKKWLLLGIFSLFMTSNSTHAQDLFFEETFVLGRVIQVDQVQNDLRFGGIETGVREVTVQLEEPLNGVTVMQIEQYINPNNDSDNVPLKVGSQVVVAQAQIGDQITYSIQDQYRLNWMFVLFAVFVVIVLLITRKKGFFALLGLAATFIILIAWLIPSILAGNSPILTSFLGSIVIAGITFYLAHGFKKRTTLALISTLITLVLAFILSFVAVELLSLFGTGSEDALSLTFNNPGINLKGLLLGAIVIGTLGILDDVTITQIATVEQVHDANPSLPFEELYRRGHMVGKDHIASIINTLVLAYVGAAFPALLLLVTSHRPLWVNLNSEFMAEEVVRTLVGSMTLMVAVPISTVFAAYFYSKAKNKRRNVHQ